MAVIMSEGYVVVLTKPLGSTVALAAHKWLEENDMASLGRIASAVSKIDIQHAYENFLAFKHTEKSIDILNMWDMHLQSKYSSCNLIVEVDELGILGHAKDIVRTEKLDCVIANLPVIAKMDELDLICKNEFNLIQGRAPENLGGVMICMSRQEATNFVSYLKTEKGIKTWIVGEIVKGTGVARMSKNPFIIQVAHPNSHQFKPKMKKKSL